MSNSVELKSKKSPLTLQQTKNSYLLKKKLFGISLTLPALFFIFITMILPMMWNLVLSFTSWDGFSSLEFIGFENYVDIFKDQVTLNGLYYSVLIAAVSTIIAMVLGLGLALMIYKVGNREGAFYRFVFFSPSMMPFTVIGFIFIFVLSPDVGLVNNLLGVLGLERFQHAWLSEPGTVLWVIAIISGWRLSGLVMMLCYTAIITIPSSMFEAARMEGLNYVQQIRHIILPLIKPMISLVTMLSLIISFKTYDDVYVMTSGGPGDSSRTAPVRMLDIAFSYNQFGYGAAIGVLLTILVAVSVLIVQKMLKGESYEY